MRVLGIDPGLTRCGVGIVDGAVGSPLSLVEVGVVLTPVDAPLEQRLLDLDQQLSQWINVWKPDVVAVERVFFATQCAHRNGYWASCRSCVVIGG